MDYPMRENAETATFWSNVTQIRGVRTNGHFYGGQFLEGGKDSTAKVAILENNETKEKSEWYIGVPSEHERQHSARGDYFSLYEITTDAAADAINALVAAASDPWWVSLLVAFLDPPENWGDVLFAMSDAASSANMARHTFWHTHHFAKGDRVYVLVKIAESVGAYDYRVGCSIIGTDYRRYIMHGNVARWEIRQLDNQIGVLPDPPPPPSLKDFVTQITIINQMHYPITKIGDTLMKGSWVPGKSPPESMEPGASAVCQVTNVDYHTAGNIAYTSDLGEWSASFAASHVPGSDEHDEYCRSPNDNKQYGLVSKTESVAPTGLPDGSSAWTSTLHFLRNVG